MDKCRTERGQTIVELAIVLPCFCLGIFMGVQLMWCCHNFVELQRMAQVMIDRVTLENYQSQKTYTRFNSLWGEHVTPVGHFQSRQAPPWLPNKGLKTMPISGPTQLVGVYTDSTLLHGDGFTDVLSNVTERGYAETFLEPPLPGEE